MWKILAIASMAFIVGACSFHIGGQMNTETVGMALGVLMGILAGLPVALLAMAGKEPKRIEHNPQPTIMQVAPGRYVHTHKVGYVLPYPICDECGRGYEMVGDVWRHTCTQVAQWKVVDHESIR